MPFILSHAIAGSAIGSATLPLRTAVPRRVLWLGALCGAFPDFDYLWTWLEPQDWHVWYGHRGISHTPLIAALLAVVLVRWALPEESPLSRGRVWLAFFLATVSHPILDAMSTYGPGIPFFFPVSTTRYFLPWRFLTGNWGPDDQGLLRTMATWWWKEILWIWLPAGLLLALTAWRRRSSAPPAAAAPRMPLA